MWIRSPWYDGFWFLSGIPFAVFLSILTITYWDIPLSMEMWWRGVPLRDAVSILTPYVAPATIVLWIVFLLQTAHLLSPIALAWGHDGFRKAMFRRKIKFIYMPLVILGSATAAGVIGGLTLHDIHFDAKAFALAAGPQTLADFQNPFMAMVFVYLLWNAYHFGKQTFGVMALYRKNRGGKLARQVDLMYSCAVIWCALFVPFIVSFGRGLYHLTGWPPSRQPFLSNVHTGYIAASATLLVAMLGFEACTTRSLPRTIFIFTNGISMICAFWFGLWDFAIVGMNHWLVAIGLSSHVYSNYRRINAETVVRRSACGGESGLALARMYAPLRYGLYRVAGAEDQGGIHLRSVTLARAARGAPTPLLQASPLTFAAILIMAGVLLFSVLFVRHYEFGISTAMLSFTTITVGFRLGLGFVHFLYDRWLYRFSDPQVRATIGKAVFG